MDRDGGTYTFSGSVTNELSFLYEDDCSFGWSESGDYKPSGSFGSFIGGSSYGFWNLSIFDGFTSDEGFVESWQLTLVREVSEPTGLALMSLSLIALSYSSKKRRK